MCDIPSHSSITASTEAQKSRVRGLGGVATVLALLLIIFICIMTSLGEALKASPITDIIWDHHIEVAPQAIEQHKITCNPGSRAVGGGYKLVRAYNNHIKVINKVSKLQVLASYPAPLRGQNWGETARSWIVIVQNKTKEPQRLKIFVSCMKG